MTPSARTGISTRIGNMAHLIGLCVCHQNATHHDSTNKQQPRYTQPSFHNMCTCQHDALDTRIGSAHTQCSPPIHTRSTLFDGDVSVDSQRTRDVLRLYLCTLRLSALPLRQRVVCRLHIELHRRLLRSGYGSTCRRALWRGGDGSECKTVTCDRGDESMTGSAAQAIR